MDLNTSETANEESYDPVRANERSHNPIIRFLLTIRSSFIAFIISVGVLFIVTGFVIQNGSIAGILAVLGASAIVYGIIGDAVLRFVGYK
jgi:drug/metabolite transporter (DMT)-like permease